MTRARKTALRLVSWETLDAVVLGVDPGLRSGAAVVAGRELIRAWDDIGSRQQRYDVCDFAWDDAQERELPLVTVVESWNPHGKWGFDAAMGLAEQAGRWLDAIESRIGSSPHGDLVVRVESLEWRRAVFGGWANKPTAEWKAQAQSHIEAHFDKRLDDNAAEAVCMALWAQHARRVAEALRLSEQVRVRREKAERRSGAVR